MIQLVLNYCLLSELRKISILPILSRDLLSPSIFARFDIFKKVNGTSIEKTQIFEAIQKIYSKSFISKLNKAVNPYGEGGGSEKILKIIKSRDLPTTLQKEFKDIKQ